MPEVMALVLLLLIAVVVIVILKPTPLDRARKKADKIISTRQSTPQEIKELINSLAISGLYDAVTSDGQKQKKDIEDRIRKGETQEEIASSMISSAIAKNKENEKIDKLKALLKEIDKGKL